MANLLVINSSSAREHSISRVLVEEAVARLTEASPEAVIVRRDLGVEPVPHLAIGSRAFVESQGQRRKLPHETSLTY
jgi:FMN-dependent NADH-azoreductase